MATVDIDDVSHRDRIRPVIGATSEGCLSGTYTPTGTNGILMRITNPSIADPSLQTTNAYTTGALVRVSTNRIYAGVNQNSLGVNITQPGSADGGTKGDVVGQFIGYVPIEDDGSVDIAMRSASFQWETPQLHSIRSSWDASEMYGVRRNTSGLVDTTVLRMGLGGNDESITVTDTGRDATITYTTDSSGSTNSYTLQGQIRTESPSDANENTSGAPVIDADGQLIGMWIGTSDAGNGVIQTIANMERAIGAHVITGLGFTALNSNLSDRMFTGDPLTPRLDEYGTTG